MSKVIKAGKGLTCGCCGTWFTTWEGYEDQDQDRGYGICKRCQGLIAEDERKESQKLIDCLRDGLGEAEKAKFDSMDWELQRAIALQALEDGVISYNVTRRHS